ncbi:MAG: BrnT family toxin [Rhodopila sp.]
MDIEFDAAKDEINRLKHGVSLVLGAEVMMNRIGQIDDDRRDYGEARFNAFGLVNGRLFICSYTMRGPTYRLISVRKASKQEQRRWQP